MAKMTFYYSPSSPYARKVLVLAHEAGLADRLEVIGEDRDARVVRGPDVSEDR